MKDLLTGRFLKYIFFTRNLIILLTDMKPVVLMDRREHQRNYQMLINNFQK